MPSFDIVSEFDSHEMHNAVDQASRELTTRFDFRNVEASFKLNENAIDLSAEHDFQIEQMLLILRNTMAKRKLDLRVLGDPGTVRSGKQIRQSFPLREGLEQTVAKDILRKIKDAKLKVQASIQGDKVRVTGKKRDDLQEVMHLLRGDESISVPLQFDNFRD